MGSIDIAQLHRKVREFDGTGDRPQSECVCDMLKDVDSVVFQVVVGTW